VLFQLCKGDLKQAAQELLAFKFEPYISVVIRPQLDHAVMQAEVALALRRWDACIAASEQVQTGATAPPSGIRARPAGPCIACAECALAAQGRGQEARAARQEATAIHSAMLGLPVS